MKPACQPLTHIFSHYPYFKYDNGTQPDILLIHHCYDGVLQQHPLRTHAPQAECHAYDNNFCVHAMVVISDVDVQTQIKKETKMPTVPKRNGWERL